MTTQVNRCRCVNNLVGPECPALRLRTGRGSRLYATAPCSRAIAVLHCAAIASAIPCSVRLRFFQRSGDGGSRCTRAARPSTIFVGSSFGRPFSQRQVAFVSPCPNCQGWIICVGFSIRVLITPIGFSRATQGIGAFRSFQTKASAAPCSARRSANHRAPLTARYVQGGKATSKSHWHRVRKGITSPCRCWPGRSEGNRSHDHASWPRAVKASRTVPLNSQATRILMLASFLSAPCLPRAYSIRLLRRVLCQCSR